MYFLTALGCTLIGVLLWVLFRKKKQLHFEYLAIIFGGATLMWLIDCIASAASGEGFLSFEMPTDLYISLWTVGGGLAFYLVLVLVLFIIKKSKEKKATKACF